MQTFNADILIVGGGTGSCAAARAGRRVIMTKESDGIGGQLTSKAVAPDEHGWIELHRQRGQLSEKRSKMMRESSRVVQRSGA